MNSGVKAAAAVGQAAAICQVLLWAIWQSTGLAIPQEVSIPFVVGFAPVIHGLMSWVEKRTGVDIVANGNGKEHA